MSDLSAEVLRRNARLRAFRSFGVPVEGGWQAHGYGATLQILCSICRKRITPTTLEDGRTPEVLRRILWVERFCLLGSCSHLAPLAGEDPPDLAALIALELLAGPGA